LTAVLWIFLVLQLAALPSAFVEGGANLLIAGLLAATTAQGLVTLHSRAMGDWLASAEASRRRRFPLGVEWALLAGVPTLFASAAAGVALSRTVWTLLDGADTPPRSVRAIGPALGCVMSTIAIAKLPRTRAPLYALQILALLTLSLHAVLSDESSGISAFDIVFALLAAVGIFATRDRRLTQFLENLEKRGTPQNAR
jgi:hypothetical protein